MLFLVLSAVSGLILSLTQQKDQRPIQYEYAELIIAECETGKLFSSKDPIRRGLCATLYYDTKASSRMQDSLGKVTFFNQPIHALNFYLDHNPDWELVSKEWRYHRFSSSSNTDLFSDTKRNADGRVEGNAVFLLRRMLKE